MSEISAEIIIHTGSDPRARPEFEAIRQEMNKINHPARPEVNWGLIESLAITLFRTQGVDLQTAVCYTVARAHQQGLAGLTEGCELLAAMVVHQWQQLWPEAPQARTDILEWFSVQTCAIVRQHASVWDDRERLCCLQHALQLLWDKLQQAELKRLPHIDDLLALIQNTIKRLQPANSGGKATLPAVSQKMRLHYVGESPSVQHPPAEDAVRSAIAMTVVSAQPLPARRFMLLWGFMSGVLLSLILIAGGYFIWIKPGQQQLTVLSALPEGTALQWLSKPELATYGEQLQRLDSFSPLIRLQLADTLVAAARKRWPDSAVQQAESRRREQLLRSRIMINKNENSYLRVQQQLQALSDELQAREKSRSSLTISYLKTAVYQMQSQLNQHVPLEELMRQYQQTLQDHQPVSPVLAKQIEDRLNQLLSRYYRLTAPAGERADF